MREGYSGNYPDNSYKTADQYQGKRVGLENYKAQGQNGYDFHPGVELMNNRIAREILTGIIHIYQPRAD
ncbi:MAG: hypothetical protein PHE82_11005 [Syntrophomonadaceae bacterium]|nr:hypothetical protein [Syntrophomonadaceae bacterium]